MYVSRSEQERRQAADARLAELRQQMAREERAEQSRQVTAQRHLVQAHKEAGKSHTRVVLDLYDLLGIAPEHPRQRVISTGDEQRTVPVSADKDEKLRTQRLYHLVEQLLQLVTEEDLKSLQEADAAGRDERHAQRRMAHPKS